MRVQGLVEVQRALRGLDEGAPKELRKANLDVAEWVAELTRGSYHMRESVAHEVAESVRAQAEQRAAAIRIGGPSAPMAGGSEFGSSQYKQFPPWRGSSRDAGYSLFPTIRDRQREILERHERHVDDLIRKHFPS